MRKLTAENLDEATPKHDGIYFMKVPPHRHWADVPVPLWFSLQSNQTTRQDVKRTFYSWACFIGTRTRKPYPPTMSYMRQIYQALDDGYDVYYWDDPQTLNYSVLFNILADRT